MNDGGQAFPLGGNDTYGSEEGMTLLDYFAGQALAGASGQYKKMDWNPEDMADWCYRVARLMIHEREHRINQGGS